MTNSAPDLGTTEPTPPPLGHSNKIFSYFMLFFLVVAFLLGFVLVEPFLHTIIISAVLAIIFSPMNLRIYKRLGGNTLAANVAAGITVAVVVFLLILPTAFLVWGLVTQGMDSLTAIRQWAHANDVAEFAHSQRFDEAFRWLRERVPFLSIDEASLRGQILDVTRKLSQSMLDISAKLVGNTAKLVLRFFLMLFMLFYFLREGRGLVQKIKYLAPLRTHQEDFIFESLQKVSQAVLIGSLLIAVLQGLAGALGLYLAGIPPLFWGAMMGLAALIPVIGTGLIWIPATAYLYLFNDWRWALFFLIYNVVIVTNIDTILRPMLMRRAAQVSPFFIFLAILGGLHAFGALGIIYGPLILTFLMVMLKIYSEEYKEVLTSRAGYHEYRNEP
jgi:predicted PurR-regulated permease PerM